jgi:hypothetical protein
MTTPIEQRLTILDKLAELETSVGELYGAYVALFPQHEQTWSGLINQGKHNAVRGQELRARIEKGAVKFDENRFNISAIQSYINYLDGELAKASERTLVNALSVTRYIEESLIERDYFSIFEGESGPTERQLAVLDKMAELETSVGKLYEAYAALYPDFREFWAGMVIEEKQHAVWVLELRSRVEKGAAKFSENRFNINAIQSYISYLKDELEKASGRTVVNALSIAEYIEDSLIERDYFTIVEGDSDELKETLKKLADATHSHNRQVREAIRVYNKPAR